jgi:hypothetical protein
MGDLQARRDRRYNFQIPVKMLSRSGEIALVTEDVSYRGVFLRTLSPPPKMQLLRLRLEVPTMAKGIVTNATVAHVAGPEARVPGAGLSFYGLDGEPRRQWEGFIQFVRDHHPDAAERQAAADHAAEQDRLRAREQVIIAIASVAAFERLVARDIAQGTLFVHSDAPIDVSAPVCVRLIHPETQHSFLLDGVVRHRLKSGGFHVALRKMSEKELATLHEFVRGDNADADAIEIIEFESVRPNRPSARATM